MKQMEVSNVEIPPPSQFWMRAVSFAGLHRILNAVGDAPNGLRAKEINELVLERGVTLTPRSSRPKPTTLYHYRNALLRLHVLVRHGRRLVANVDNPNVRALLHQPAPANGNQSLSDAAREHFAVLVLSNDQCRTLFFDLFMPSGENCASVSNFRENGVPVSWTRKRLSGATEVLFENKMTGHIARHISSGSVPAILYGLRYWARDELKLVDEYCQRADDGTIMFPVSRRSSSMAEHESSVLQAVRFLLDLRTTDEWTLFSISDLIVNYCQTHRQPRALLFDAIDWLRREWPYHTILIPTSLGLATLTATSPQREGLELRRYYKSSHGPYISHFRIHEDVAIETKDATRHHAPICLRSSALNSTLSSRLHQACPLGANSFLRKHWRCGSTIFLIGTRPDTV